MYATKVAVNVVTTIRQQQKWKKDQKINKT